MPPGFACQVFQFWTSNATAGPALRFPIGLADGRHLGARYQRLSVLEGASLMRTRSAQRIDYVGEGAAQGF